MQSTVTDVKQKATNAEEVSTTNQDSYINISTSHLSLDSTGCQNTSAVGHRLSLHRTKHHFYTRKGQRHKFVCTVCRQMFSNYCSLKRHMHAHNGVRPIACSICHLLFLHPNNLRRHMLRHTQENSHQHRKIYPDGKCPESNDEISVDSMGKSSTVGSSLTPTVDSLQKVQENLLPVENPHCCTVCGKLFLSLSKLTVHVQTHHTESRYTCHICGKVFAGSKGLKSHIRTHTGERPFSCLICEQNFAERTSLRMHMLRHSGEKPHSCSICGRCFTTSSALKRHAYSHSDKREQFTCELCYKQFSAPHVLKRHMRIHTGERPFSCFVCECTFTQLTSLKTHIMNIHTGERPHGCSECGKHFVTAAKVRRHMTTHNKKPKQSFVCDVCSQIFSQLCKLKRHTSVHNKTKTRKLK